MNPPLVSIIGAGLGGLCLAHALNRAGVPFHVFERDAAPDARRQGYRIRIDAGGQKALAASLPPDRYALFRQTCALSTAPPRILSAQLAPSANRAPASWTEPGDEATAADLSANRLTLREILMSGIEDRVSFGRAFARFELTCEGQVAVRFEDGESVASSVLVGADGAASRVRQQLAPLAAPQPTGAVCIYGRSPLPVGASGLDQGATVILGGGCAAVIEAMRFAAPFAGLTAVADYLYWALTAPASHFQAPSGAERLEEAEVRERLGAAIADWHPQLRRALLAAEPGGLDWLAVRRGRPDVAWSPGPVTLLGDAVHVMSPAGGLGANTALADASALGAALSAACAGRLPLATALSGYEADLRARGAAAIAASDEGAARLYAAAG